MTAHPRRPDLHCHSNISDGTHAPAWLAQRAHSRGVDLWALTDHDEVGGVAEAAATARTLGLPFLPGVEISVTWEEKTIHIVGLGIDENHTGLLQGLQQTRAGRVQRGQAMALWGAVAGVATLVGPILGGVLIDSLGWEWIFFVNVPVGVIGFVLAWLLVPRLETHGHRFDLVGVVLSAVALFLIVFGLQEGQGHHWAPWIWAVIVAGIGFMAAFVYWQSINPGEPLVPLRVFRDPDFSLSAIGVAVIGFAVTAMVLPLYFYAQQVMGLSPTGSAVLTAPMALTSGEFAVLKALVSHPREPLSRDKLMNLARGREWDALERSIDVQISRLRRLIEPDPSKPRYIQTVWGVGYVFVPDGSKS